jgi:hypothetical protein
VIDPFSLILFFNIQKLTEGALNDSQIVFVRIIGCIFDPLWYCNGSNSRGAYRA